MTDVRKLAEEAKLWLAERKTAAEPTTWDAIMFGYEARSREMQALLDEAADVIREYAPGFEILLDRLTQSTSEK